MWICSQNPTALAGVLTTERVGKKINKIRIGGEIFPDQVSFLADCDSRHALLPKRPSKGASGTFFISKKTNPK